MVGCVSEVGGDHWAVGAYFDFIGWGGISWEENGKISLWGDLVMLFYQSINDIHYIKYFS